MYGPEHRRATSNIAALARRISWGLALILVASCTRSATPDVPEAQPEVAPPPSDPEQPHEGASADPDCTRACARWIECAGAEHGPSCMKDCEAELLPANPKAPAHYARCLEDLECEDIVASLAMDSGPAGLCYTTAATLK